MISWNGDYWENFAGDLHGEGGSLRLTRSVQECDCQSKIYSFVDRCENTCGERLRSCFDVKIGK